MMSCKGCSYHLPHNPGTDQFYLERVRPLMYFCAAMLPTAYLVGLWFTLRTHVKQIYHDKKHDSMILDFAPPAKTEVKIQQPTLSHQSSDEFNIDTQTPAETDIVDPQHDATLYPSQAPVVASETQSSHQHEAAGHDAPEWSKTKSATILMVSTVLFSLLAELLVDSVDEVISTWNIDAKFLGLTLFALVPNVTEFMNAMAFAMYGNVALSLEIGSAYAVQVALLQIPFLVFFSGFWNNYYDLPDTVEKSFTLMFPQWDVYTVFFSVFLLSYTYLEGKSNYFKGALLSFAYLTLIISFYFAPSSHE
jgi:Ca2+:H+ antiporter